MLTSHIKTNENENEMNTKRTKNDTFLRMKRKRNEMKAKQKRDENGRHRSEAFEIHSNREAPLGASHRPFKKGEAHQRVRRWAGRPARRLAGRPAGRAAGRSAGRPAGRPGGARVVSGAEKKII